MTGFRLPGSWPPPADPVAAALLVEALADPPPTNTDDADLAERRLAMIRCLGGNSRYLSDLARRESAFLAGFVQRGPAWMLSLALRRLRTLKPQAPRHEIAAGLRQAKRQVALVTALADLGGLWSLSEITGALSLLAELALRMATAHLLHAAHMSGQIALPDPEHPDRGSGFIVLGMGKLGARELNYSSDIDLVLIFDPEPQGERDDVSRAFSRIAAGLVSLMEARDADGYVFRTDLRLRPDPGATPPAVSLPAALTYYESYGRTWERAAMIKARPVAGDLDAGARFLRSIEPFIWRRTLDFAAIDDIHAMKHRIDRNKPAPAKGFAQGAAGAQSGSVDPVSALLGHDLKLGHGGIREIEFIAQTLLLVWAGRSPALRDPTTLGALDKLARAGHLKRDRAASLASTYVRLRRLEHRLQMQDDRQTHSLPADLARFEAFALFAGAGNAAALAGGLLPELRRTRARFDAMFRSPTAEPDQNLGQNLGQTTSQTTGKVVGRPSNPSGVAGFHDAPDAEARLASFGFGTSRRALDILQGWQTDRYRALREPRARALLAGLVPSLLEAFALQSDPIGVLLRFDTLLSRQNAGVQFLSLLHRTPSLLERIAFILGASPTLGDHLAAVPAALDGLLEPEPAATASRTVLRNLDMQMRGASDIEEAIRIARTLVRGEEFRLGVAELDGALGVDQAASARTALAERVIGHLLRVVQREHRQRYGTVPGGAIAVMALGKAGSREMMAGSDLDLMLIYDHPETVQDSVPARGATRTLPPSQYFARLAHALIAALSAPGVEGPLYALDMRLRPSGSKGPVAVSLEAFRRYHRTESWTWERMALTRARVVAGPEALRTSIRTALAEALEGIPPEALPGVRPGMRPSVLPAARAGTRPGTAAGTEANAAAGAAAQAGAQTAEHPGAQAGAQTGAQTGVRTEANAGPKTGTEAGTGAGADRLRADAVSMRARLARDLPARGPWDVKLRRGGLMEVEFIAQVLQLAAGTAEARHPTTRVAFRRLGRAGLLDAQSMRRLMQAERFWRGLQSRLRILLGTQVPPSLPGPLPPAAIVTLLSGLDRRAGMTSDLDGLAASCEAMAATVRALFEHLVGPVPATTPIRNAIQEASR